MAVVKMKLRDALLLACEKQGIKVHFKTYGKTDYVPDPGNKKTPRKKRSSPSQA